MGRITFDNRPFLTSARMILFLLATFLLSTAGAQEERTFGRLGFGIKTGECVGPFGSQVSYNLGSHLQVAAGVGGIRTDIILIDFSGTRVDSYFLLAKYYFRHAYLSSGYSAKVISTQELDSNWVVHKDRLVTNGIPLHLGYEFGNRSGFFTAVSIGYIWVPVGGGRYLRKKNLSVTDGFTKVMGGDSGASAGVSIGYYLF